PIALFLSALGERIFSASAVVEVNGFFSNETNGAVAFHNLDKGTLKTRVYIVVSVSLFGLEACPCGLLTRYILETTNQSNRYPVRNTFGRPMEGLLDWKKCTKMRILFHGLGN
ncbi:hypothetical protein K432DRAFT_306867, partial [Lepidopterella palustris CBS 459.81]